MPYSSKSPRDWKDLEGSGVCVTDIFPSLLLIVICNFFSSCTSNLVPVGGFAFVAVLSHQRGQLPFPLRAYPFSSSVFTVGLHAEWLGKELG